MIRIKIDNPAKLSNNVLVKKSAYVSFDYKAEIVSFIKNMGTRVYDPSTHTWEMPLQNIISLCNHFTTEEIEITGIYENLTETSVEDMELPSNFKFKTEPFSHQVDGVKFGLNKKKYLLCDEQGLGKSKQVIDTVECLACEGKIKKALIICGVNSLKYNWQNEVEIHSDAKAYVLGTRYRKNGNMYEGSTQDKLYDLDNLPDCRYIITNIETLRAGVIREKVGRRTKYTFPVIEKLQKLCKNGEISLIAFDEAHKAKNPTSLQGQALLKLSAEYEIAMTGTPLLNNPMDLYVPLKWTGYETHSFYQFKNHYCRLGGFNGSEIIGYKNLNEVKELLDTVMLRRLKDEVLDLPEKIISTEYVEMTSKQAVVYKEVLNGLVTDYHKIQFSNNPLAMLTRLRQVTGFPQIVSDVTESAKFDRLEEIVEELALNGKKAVIFSNWTQITEQVKNRLQKYNPAYITGDTKSEDRMVEVDRFQNNDSCKVAIGTIGAMGTGLTLTAGSTVIFLDLPWTRGIFDQCVDRCHRIGTKGTVNVIKLECVGTIDERIDELVYKKGLLSDAIVDGSMGKVDMNFINQLLF